MTGWTISPCSEPSQTPKFQCLLLDDGQTPEWLEGDAPISHGGSWTPSIGQAPSWHDGSGSFSWQILEDGDLTKYYLSPGQCSRILALAQKADCPPPREIEALLLKQGGVVSGGQIDFAGSNVTATVNGDVLAEAIFDVTSGNTVVINAPANVTLNNDSVTGDNWAADGTVQLNGGTFNFTGTKNGSNGIFQGNNGKLNITSESQSFIVAADSYIKAETSVDLAKGSSLNVAGGDVVLNNNDIFKRVQKCCRCFSTKFSRCNNNGCRQFYNE